MLSKAGAPLPALAELFAGLERSIGLLLAVSGGPDSTALLVLADRWRKDSGVAVSVATVDHGLRPASRQEAEAVGAVCAARGLPHAILPWTDEKPATGVPAAARAARYRLLGAQARKIGADMIVTAHHADDQAETVLMRLLRGSGPAGLAGMARRAPAFWPDGEGLFLARPLLDCAKSDLIGFCRAEGLTYVEDPTNVDEAYRRPQIRRLAERLAREGFGRAELTRLAARAARAEQALAPAIETMLAALPARREAAVFETPAEAILALHDEAIVRLLSREIARIGGAAARLEQVEKIASGLRQKSRFSATLGGVAIRLDAKRLILQPQKPRKRRAES
ncbi:MAG: tRNA lysidine(34) synthetase TilS [Hyphomicrobiales bacterium]|nr:tRNA lysidine(34) synthetase TilS [Rhodoblastus sp.]MCC2102380.1 tRNA lysidine(34) synthetase TilS [Hyphomicrobiales bacterium]MCC2105254.1 tRNA lysidine(34) synthetase TilS [Hyphomicrobiales bacterium]